MNILCKDDTGIIAHFSFFFFISINIYILFCHSLIYLFTNGQSFFFFSYDLNVLWLPFLQQASVPLSCRGREGGYGGGHRRRRFGLLWASTCSSSWLFHVWQWSPLWWAVRFHEVSSTLSLMYGRVRTTPLTSVAQQKSKSCVAFSVYTLAKD